jgi:hypothetical protein
LPSKLILPLTFYRGWKPEWHRGEHKDEGQLTQCFILNKPIVQLADNNGAGEKQGRRTGNRMRAESAAESAHNRAAHVPIVYRHYKTA